MNEITSDIALKTQQIHEQQGIEKVGGRTLSTLERPEATYSFLYISHLDNIVPQMIPQKTTHTWMETGEDDWHEHPEALLNSFSRTLPEFNTMLPILEQRRIPLLLGELSVNEIIGAGDFFAEFGIEFSESTLSLAMWAYLAMNVKKIELTRRDFLKAGKMVMVVGVAQWLSMPVLASLGRVVTTLSGEGHEITKVMKQISDKLHPEDFTLSQQIRGTLLSYKEKWLAKKLGIRPYFFTPIGGEHSRVETEIDETDKSQLAFLKNWAPVLRAVVNPTTFSDIKELKFNGQRWAESNSWHIPELQQILSDS